MWTHIFYSAITTRTRYTTNCPYHLYYFTLISYIRIRLKYKLEYTPIKQIHYVSLYTSTYKDI